MNACEDIGRLLDQWLQLTHAEAAAIQSGAWEKLGRIHSAKDLLRIPLDNALAEWKAAGGSDLPYRAELQRLIALEAHHAQLVTARREDARRQQTDLDRSRRTLRQLRQSYAPANSTALNSYS